MGLNAPVAPVRRGHGAASTPAPLGAQKVVEMSTTAVTIVYVAVLLVLVVTRRVAMKKIAMHSYKAGWYEGRGKLLANMKALEQEPVYIDEPLIGRFVTELGLAASYSDAARDPEFAAILDKELNDDND